MSGTFTDAARRLAGATALVLGWRPDEFWRATPAELATIFDGLRQAQADHGGMPLTRAELATLMERDRDG